GAGVDDGDTCGFAGFSDLGDRAGAAVVRGLIADADGQCRATGGRQRRLRTLHVDGAIRVGSAGDRRVEERILLDDTGIQWRGAETGFRGLRDLAEFVEQRLARYAGGEGAPGLDRAERT